MRSEGAYNGQERFLPNWMATQFDLSDGHSHVRVLGPDGSVLHDIVDVFNLGAVLQPDLQHLVGVQDRQVPVGGGAAEQSFVLTRISRAT